MHDERTTPHPTRPSTRGWLRRRHEPETDSVQIDAEESYSWWAARDEVSATASTRRAQDRQAAEPSAAAKAAALAFAPASEPSLDGPTPDAQPGVEPNPDWDTDSLFRWVDTTVDSESPRTGTDPTNPWDVLGLSPDVPWLEVVRRHRLLAKHLHPDLHGAADHEIRREIEVRMAQINAAFEDLESIYGMSKGA